MHLSIPFITRSFESLDELNSSPAHFGNEGAFIPGDVARDDRLLKDLVRRWFTANPKTISVWFKHLFSFSRASPSADSLTSFGSLYASGQRYKAILPLKQHFEKKRLKMKLLSCLGYPNKHNKTNPILYPFCMNPLNLTSYPFFLLLMAAYLVVGLLRRWEILNWNPSRQHRVLSHGACPRS